MVSCNVKPIIHSESLMCMCVTNVQLSFRPLTLLYGLDVSHHDAWLLFRARECFLYACISVVSVFAFKCVVCDEQSCRVQPLLAS